MKNVAILLATYNGEKYIKKQINSLINQDYDNWNLYIRDDGSTDNTIKIIKNYQKKLSEKIILINDNKNLKSPKLNFFEIIAYMKKKNKEYDYYMFCDQDDIWDSNKISKMINIANKYDDNIPLVVHCDSRLIDENDEIICNSFNKISKINMNRVDFKSICLWNVSQGCSMLINNSCLEYLPNNLKNIIMHDWWFCIIASLFGNIEYCNNSLISYRQHSNNCIGGQKQKTIFYFLKFKNIKQYLIKTKSTYNNVKMQVSELDIFKNNMTNAQLAKYLEIISIFKNNNFFSRIQFCKKNKFIQKKGIKTIIGYYFLG